MSSNSSCEPAATTAAAALADGGAGDAAGGAAAAQVSGATGGFAHSSAQHRDKLLSSSLSAPPGPWPMPVAARHHWAHSPARAAEPTPGCDGARAPSFTSDRACVLPFASDKAGAPSSTSCPIGSDARAAGLLLSLAGAGAPGGDGSGARVPAATFGVPDRGEAASCAKSAAESAAGGASMAPGSRRPRGVAAREHAARPRCAPQTADSART